MSNLRRASQEKAIRLDDPVVALDLACQRERGNWMAARIGLPTIGSTLLNRHGIEWVVQSHATAPTYDSLLRWRNGDIRPIQDMYPEVVPTNFSERLMEFFNAIDRCTTKTFAMLDTMPGRRKDGHIPGGNSIDTICHPATNMLFLDAAAVPETVIAHEFGHAWVQYVDECEDFRTLEDASDPQRMRQVGFVQSYVLDLKVNDLLRRKGFDMSPIEEDQGVSVLQLAQALSSGYTPEHPREQVFMALLVADEMIERDCGRGSSLARFDESLAVIRHENRDIADLAERFAGPVRRHGYDSHAAIMAGIDECLLASFEHCGDSIDLDRELVVVNPEEPNIDKFPAWLPPLQPKTKTIVGKYMARNDISSDWFQCLETAITGNARARFRSPDGDKSDRLQLHQRIGPPNRYSDLPDDVAEMLAMKHLNETKSYQTHGGPPHKMSDLYNRYNIPDPGQTPQRRSPNGAAPQLQMSSTSPQSLNPGFPHISDSVQQLAFPPVHAVNRLPRPYMAGTGRFLTAARWQEQLEGEHPYAYANNNPITYTDPSGLQAVQNPYQQYQQGWNKCIQDTLDSISNWFQNWLPKLPTFPAPCDPAVEAGCRKLCADRHQPFVSCTQLDIYGLVDCQCEGCPPYNNLPLCNSQTQNHIMSSGPGHRWPVGWGSVKSCIDSIVSGNSGRPLPVKPGSTGQQPCKYSGTCFGRPVAVTIGYQPAPCISNAWMP